MALKVFVQHIWPHPRDDRLLGEKMAVVYDGQESLMRRILGPDAVIRQSFNARSAYYSNCASMETYNNVGMLEGLRNADADGFDVAFITCGNDPALHAARDLLSIPVVGATESAMLMACALGMKFGCVTFDEQSTALIERNIRLYGLQDRALSFRPARSAGYYEASDTWFSDPEYFRGSVVPKFEAAAKSLIADGADVIVGACGNFAAFPYHGYVKVTGTEVPVMDAVMCGTFMAKLMGELHRTMGVTTSKSLAFRGVPRELAAKVLAPFAIGAA